MLVSIPTLQKVPVHENWKRSTLLCFVTRFFLSGKLANEMVSFTVAAIGITYLPHKAVAEVSKDKEPIGRECAEFNWFESQLMSDSIEVRFKWFGLSSDLKFKRFGCQLIWDSNDLAVNRCVLQMILVVCWFELQVMWLSVDFRFKWFGCRLIWDSSDLVVNRFEI